MKNTRCGLRWYSISTTYGCGLLASLGIVVRSLMVIAACGTHNHSSQIVGDGVVGVFRALCGDRKTWPQPAARVNDAETAYRTSTHRLCFCFIAKQRKTETHHHSCEIQNFVAALFASCLVMYTSIARATGRTKLVYMLEVYIYKN